MTPARIIEGLLFGGRWLVVPAYVTMLGLLVMLVVYFIGEFIHAVPGLARISENDLIILTLSLIDLSLTANLVVLVILSGYENFVRSVEFREGDGRPKWLVGIDFSGLKLKLMATVSVIAAIHLLRSFLDIDNETDHELLWQTIIVVVFAVLSLLIAVTDRVADGGH